MATHFLMVLDQNADPGVQIGSQPLPSSEGPQEGITM